jgi:hypothetical protein
MLASAAVTAAVLRLSAPEARAQVEIFVTVSVTNNTPTTLIEADRGDAFGTFWSDSQVNEIGPPTPGT